MTLTPHGYRTRLVDNRISAYLETFGAVSIEGPKWCGKTWTARNHCNSEFQLDKNGLKLLEADVNYAFEGEKPHLIDEWQDYPDLWDEVRFEVDRSSEKGRFILCGSSALDISIKKHSGAGRIGSIRMHTMSLFESGDSDGAVSLKGLFNGELARISCKETPLTKLIDVCYRGGWPALMSSEIEHNYAVDDYIEKLCKEDISKIDGKTRNPNKMRMMLRSFARNESTIVADSAIRRDMKEYDDENISESTIDDYKGALEALGILWYQPAFSTNIRSSARIGKKPKKHLADPSLVMNLLGLSKDGAVKDLETFEFVFESLCERDLLIYSEYNGYRLFHYRDNSGKEIDAVVECPDGRWGAFEIKLGAGQVDKASEQLIAISEKFEKKPEFLCVLCGTAVTAYKRPDGVIVVPITRLGP